MTSRMNREVKEEAQMIFSELGMDMTTAINVFIRQAIHHSGFPFEVVLPTPNDEALSEMKSAEEGKDMHGPFDSVSSLMDALNNA